MAVLRRRDPSRRFGDEKKEPKGSARLGLPCSLADAASALPTSAALFLSPDRFWRGCFAVGLIPVATPMTKAKHGPVGHSRFSEVDKARLRARGAVCHGLKRCKTDLTNYRNSDDKLGTGAREILLFSQC